MITDLYRAIEAVKLLSRIRKERPQLFAEIQDFATHEFPEQAAVSQKAQIIRMDSEPLFSTRPNSKAGPDHKGQPAACSGD